MVPMVQCLETGTRFFLQSSVIEVFGKVRKLVKVFPQQALNKCLMIKHHNGRKDSNCNDLPSYQPYKPPA